MEDQRAQPPTGAGVAGVAAADAATDRADAHLARVEESRCKAWLDMARRQAECAQVEEALAVAHAEYVAGLMEWRGLTEAAAHECAAATLATEVRPGAPTVAAHCHDLQQRVGAARVAVDDATHRAADLRREATAAAREVRRCVTARHQAALQEVAVQVATQAAEQAATQAAEQAALRRELAEQAAQHVATAASLERAVATLSARVAAAEHDAAEQRREAGPRVAAQVAAQVAAATAAAAEQEAGLRRELAEQAAEHVATTVTMERAIATLTEQVAGAKRNAAAQAASTAAQISMAHFAATATTFD